MPVNWAKQKVKQWLGRDGEMHTPHQVRASFRLVYDGLTIGTLSVEAGRWTFAYSDEFKRSGELRPIVEFPDVDKVYQSAELWPFFALRIPSLKQTAIEATIKREHIDRNNEVELLRRFGQRTATNPFELIAA